MKVMQTGIIFSVSAITKDKNYSIFQDCNYRLRAITKQEYLPPMPMVFPIGKWSIK